MSERFEALLKEGDDALADRRAADAATAYREAAEMASTTVERALALHLTGVALWRAGRAREAADALDRAVQLRRVDGPPVDLARSLNALGAVLLDLEETAGTRALEEALALRVAHLGEHAPETLTTMNNLAVVMERAGRLEDAYELVARIVPHLVRGRGPAHTSVGRALNNLGALAERLGRLAEAESSYREAVRVLRQELGDRAREVALVRGNLARVEAARLGSN